MRNKIFTLIFALTFAGSLMAAVGPQSIQVTFNGDNAEGWTVASPGLLSSVGSGVANVTMAIPEGKDKYRADFQFNTTGFTMDKSKDIVWAIKLTAPLPGSSNNRKFEVQYEDSPAHYEWINKISGPSGDLTCADGGKIYYFNLGSDGLNKLSSVPEGIVSVQNIHFIMADAVIANTEDAHYSVDWIATFETVNDLKSFADWTDEAQEADASLPYHELCFRPIADGSGYEKRGNGFGTRGDDQQFEGNYQARFFAVEYFLIEDFSEEKIYTLSLTTTGGGGTYSIAVWDFPYQVNYETSASDMNSKATSVIGIAPSATEGATNAPIASSGCVSSVWTLNIPAYKLTPLATNGSKTLVGLFVTSQTLTSSSSCKFASASHASVPHPSFTQTGVNAIINTTNEDKKQWSAYSTLADAVSAASANDVVTLYDDATISVNRLTITKALTIQGATGAEKLICGVNASTLMVLANGSETDYTVTFKNLIVDGQNTSRSTQTFDANNKGQFCFENVRFINTSYSIVCGDVKNNGNAVLLKGDNSFPNGIYLNKNKRIDGKDATHATPIKVYLSSDYVEYVTILCSNDPAQYEAISANNSTGWLLEVSNSGSCSHELKTKKCLQYDLEVKAAAGMATMVIGFDAELPEGVKAYQLVYDNSPEYADGICAYEENSITKNKPVLVIAEPGTYAFKSVAGATLDEQANPEYGALKGVYAADYIPACSAGVYNYALTSGTDGVGFYQVADATNAIGAHRAYLSCSYDSQAGGGSAPRRMALHFDAHKTPTAIESAATTDSAEKLLIDGIIYIRRAEHLYRIDGQQVK